jgi:hypothetical protein
MENHDYGDVIGNPDAPYINDLADRYALATNYYAVSHPSLPNYLALLGGSTFGIDSDCTTCVVPKRSLVDQLQAHRISWKAYMQGMPSACFKGADTKRYAVHHNPFMYFPSVASNIVRCQNVVPFTQYRKDITNNDLPRFVWITPDLCNDGHDCGVYTMNKFLHNNVPKLLEHLGDNGVLFLVWDEGTTDDGCCRLASGGHVVMIAAGPGAMQATTSDVGYDHYSILRTIESSWGLGLMRHAGCSCTEPLTDLLRASGS